MNEILKITVEGIDYTWNEEQKVFIINNIEDNDEDNEVFEALYILDLLTINDIDISQVRRDRDGKIFSLGSKTDKGTINFFFYKQGVLHCVTDEDDSEYAFKLTDVTLKFEDINLKELEKEILSTNKSLLKIEGLLKKRNESVEDFIIKFFIGKGNMKEGWNYSRNTLYSWGTIQTEKNKRRSLGDIFMILRYYYPNVTLKEVLQFLYIDLFDYDHGKSGVVRSSKCNQINKRVWYYSTTHKSEGIVDSEDDEYGMNPDNYLDFLNNK